ncbi:MAG: hypothetical protein ACOYXT_05525 [Bacteroidota bacterium]
MEDKHLDLRTGVTPDPIAELEARYETISFPTLAVRIKALFIDDLVSGSVVLFNT